MESSQVPEKKLPPCTGTTKAQYGLPCAHKLLELSSENELLQKEDLDPLWHIKPSREIHDPLLQIRCPPTGIPKGRPRNSGPFGNERATPEQRLALRARQEVVSRAQRDAATLNSSWDWP